MSETKPTLPITFAQELAKISGISLSPEKKYNHGLSLAEEELLRRKYDALSEAATLHRREATIEEFKTIIVPYIRMHRVTEFNLKSIKEKTPTAILNELKGPKEAKSKKLPKVPKEARITKKQINEWKKEHKILLTKTIAGKLVDTTQIKRFYELSSLLKDHSDDK